MVYAQQIKESKIMEIKQEGKRPRFDESSQPKPMIRFYHQEYSMGNNYRDPNQNSCGGGHTFERRRYATCGKQHLGKCIACASKNHKYEGLLCHQRKMERGQSISSRLVIS